MKTSKLTFLKQKLFKTNGICSGDRNHIDFIIDGKPLMEVLNLSSDQIGKFGWGNSLSSELNEIESLKTLKSNLENHLFSIYVCAECGDEGCGTIMCEIKEQNEYIVWRNFVHGDGQLPREEDEPIKAESILFKKDDYYKAITQLEGLIKTTYNTM